MNQPFKNFVHRTLPPLILLSFIAIFFYFLVGCKSDRSKGNELGKEEVSPSSEIDESRLSRESAIQITQNEFPLKVIGGFAFTKLFYSYESVEYKPSKYDQFLINSGLLTESVQSFGQNKARPEFSVFRIERRLTEKASKYLLKGPEPCSRLDGQYFYTLRFDNGEDNHTVKKEEWRINEGELIIHSVEDIYQENNSSEVEITYNVKFNASPFYSRREIGVNYDHCSNDLRLIVLKNSGGKLTDGGTYSLKLKARKYDSGWKLTLRGKELYNSVINVIWKNQEPL